MLAVTAMSENPYQPPEVEEPTAGTGGDSIEGEMLKKSARSALFLSLGGLFCCGPLAFFGYSKGKDTLSTIRMTGQAADSESTANAAVIIAWITLGFWVLNLFWKIASV